jgi:hypothetical protein
MLSFMLSTSTTSSNKAGEFDQPLLRSSPHRLTLRTNFLWALSGNVVHAGCQWGILVVLAKLGTPQLVGEFVLGIFLWLGLAAGISYVASLLGFAMTAARYFRAQLPVFLISTLVTAAGCTLLVPRYQLLGAASQ